MTLSEHIKNLRKQEGLTQQELADRAGVGIHFVRDLEQGKKTPTWSFGGQNGDKRLQKSVL